MKKIIIRLAKPIIEKCLISLMESGRISENLFNTVFQVLDTVFVELLKPRKSK